METIATSKGQVVIPSRVRKRLGIKDRTYLQIGVNTMTKQIILTPVRGAYVRSLRGKSKGRGLTKALMAEKKMRSQKQTWTGSRNGNSRKHPVVQEKDQGIFVDIFVP